MSRFHPLAVADRRQNVVDEQRGPFGHAPAHARRAEAAALAREGDAQLVAAPRVGATGISFWRESP